MRHVWRKGLRFDAGGGSGKVPISNAGVIGPWAGFSHIPRKTANKARGKKNRNARANFQLDKGEETDNFLSPTTLTGSFHVAV